jgi:hypothetical protein
VWDVQSWLRDNAWDSEDGPSWRALCQRAYHWDTPMCWTGKNLLAVSGIGSDDEAMLPGVRIFDVSTGAEAGAFAGPAGALFAAGGRLYSAAPACFEAWDPLTGERTGTIPGFVPASYHSAAGELAGISGQVSCDALRDGQPYDAEWRTGSARGVSGGCGRSPAVALG